MMDYLKYLCLNLKRTDVKARSSSSVSRWTGLFFWKSVLQDGVMGQDGTIVLSVQCRIVIINNNCDLIPDSHQQRTI